MENELPKEDIIQLLNSQKIIKCEETSIDEVAKGLRIDNDENGITPKPNFTTLAVISQIRAN